jgi:hypothetical protein
MPRISDRLWLVLLTIFSTWLIWLPFLLHLPQIAGIPLVNHDGVRTLVANYDGPYYVAVARSFYDKTILRTVFSFPLPLEYYPAHFPLFPLLIFLGIALAVPPGIAMLGLTLTGTILAILTCYTFVREEGLTAGALGITLTFLLLPARWVVVRSVGSPEPWFIFFILASMVAYKRQQKWLSAIFGLLAVITKSPGILLFIAYAGEALFGYLKDKRRRIGQSLRDFLPYWLMPLALLGVFCFYSIRTGDFLAYFHSGDNLHLRVLPFQIFNSQAPWVGTFWLEDTIFIYLVGAAAFLNLLAQKRRLLTWFFGFYFASLIFVSHRDLARYSLPLVPFVLVAFGSYFSQKQWRWILLFMIVPVYLFTLGFISNNVVPIADWRPFL